MAHAKVRPQDVEAIVAYLLTVPDAGDVESAPNGK
jgi:hypothetical protein